MVVTAYCHCEKCTSWTKDSKGKPVFTSGSEKGKRKEIGVTASGEYARKGTIAAPSTYPFGTVMYVPGYGWGTVQDRGGAIKGDKLDLYFKSHKKALDWGRKTMMVTVYLD
jgi:3D (Asp-Asp-Asp) domain-containing protein